MKSVERLMDPDVAIFRWKMDAVDVGEAVRIGSFSDKSYGMYSIAGWSSASVTMQGSYDVDNVPPEETTWVTLNESDNTTAATLTANGHGVLLENPLWIRPKRTAGTGGNVVHVVLVCKGFK